MLITHFKRCEIITMTSCPGKHAKPDAKPGRETVTRRDFCNFGSE